MCRQYNFGTVSRAKYLNTWQASVFFWKWIKHVGKVALTELISIFLLKGNFLPTFREIRCLSCVFFVSTPTLHNLRNSCSGSPRVWHWQMTRWMNCYLILQFSPLACYCLLFQLPFSQISWCCWLTSTVLTRAILGNHHFAIIVKVSTNYLFHFFSVTAGRQLKMFHLSRLHCHRDLCDSMLCSTL
jgi:hypothetical protein